MGVRYALVFFLGFTCLAARPALAADLAVGVVPSDDAALADPVARDQVLSPDQILAMARRAVELVGGMRAFVPEDAKLVVLKPNISIVKPSGSGVVTDARVVRAAATHWARSI